MSEKYCHWFYDEHDEMFNTDCGQSFVFFGGGPRENGFRFCPYCGDTIPQAVEETT